MRDYPSHLTDGQRAMAEALPHIIWTATPDGVVDYISEELERYTGLQGLDYASGQFRWPLRAANPLFLLC